MDTRILCINCNICLNSLRRYRIVDENTRLCTLLCNWIYPHIGWNDVGFHGMNDIPTPNIDALGYSGLLLHDYYVTPICTPSRAALMTGKYPIHNGMQHSVIYGAEPRGLPLNEKLLPQYLKELGYKTHLVGKWHLGSFKKEYLPLNRGFDSHLGFWTGRIDMYDHTSQEHGSWGFDFRKGFEVAHEYFGEYVTDIYTNESVKLIKEHNASEPLFLMVAHSAVHSGNNYEYIRAPDDLIANFSYIEDYNRRKFAAVLTKLDMSVGKVVEALAEQNLLKNSIVLFTTDNGGAAGGFNNNAASNYPLRGVKNTLWEGGVRGAGALFSPLLVRPRAPRPRPRARHRLHIVDWLPTLYAAAGGNTSIMNNIDGINQWPTLSKDEMSPRTSIIHNIDDIFGSAAITVDQWKLLKGTNYNGDWDSWYGPSGRKHTYDVRRVVSCPAGRAVAALGLMPAVDAILQLRKGVTIDCPSKGGVECKPLESPCLFDIENDPCEMNNLAKKHPEILKRLLDTLTQINSTVVPPSNKPDDPKGDPKHWGRVYTNFGDYEFKSNPCHLCR